MPERIGPYRILEFLGEGGMGTVYLAEQDRPMRQKVALKLIREGYDSKRVVARFEAERQALAHMNHPNISRAFAEGTALDGRPYFVMEYVPGLPITEHCDRHRLSTEERLALFIPVCDAVQHAHQKGIVHRDLKPQNVLVMFHDGKAIPKIIDFGIAKAIEFKLTEKTLHTELGRMIGTLPYMSPEQADRTAQDIDTRSDIYSLGMLLYKLLTGVLPYAWDEMEMQGLLQTLKMIVEIEALRPSSRLLTASNDLERIAKARRTEPRALVAHLAKELDWIVMHAIEKDRNRRYPSASALAHDITCYLTGEAVSVVPPGVLYRSGKLLRRNKALAVALLGLFLALLAGTIVSTSALIDANAATERADRSLKETDWERRLTQAHLVSYQLQALEDEEKHLWPAHPSRHEAFKTWLVRAQALDERHSDLVATRDKLAERGIKDGSPEHDRLLGLLQDLDRFRKPVTGTFAKVRARWLFAQSLHEKTIEQQRAQWDRAIRSIADRAECPLYKGRRIKAQLGLIPIRKNPQGLWEFSYYQGGEVPAVKADGRLDITQMSDLVLVLIPATGRFLMGTTDKTDPDATLAEWPVHKVRLKMFFLSKYEMTQAQWQRVTGNTPSRWQPPFEQWKDVPITSLHPVENISWNRVSSVLERIGLQIPTEAQWEYATQAGQKTRWVFGNEMLDLNGKANVADKTAIDMARQGRKITFRFKAVEALDDGYLLHAPVGTFPANAFGLHEVCGNVWEWCRDWFASYKEGVNKSSGDAERVVDKLKQHQRTIRGGGFSYHFLNARSTHRTYRHPDAPTGSIGIRPARRLID